MLTAISMLTPGERVDPATTTGASMAAIDEPMCEATLDGSPERRCIRRGPHKIHRWESEDGSKGFDWG